MPLSKTQWQSVEAWLDKAAALDQIIKSSCRAKTIEGAAFNSLK